MRVWVYYYTSFVFVVKKYTITYTGTNSLNRMTSIPIVEWFSHPALNCLVLLYHQTTDWRCVSRAQSRNEEWLSQDSASEFPQPTPAIYSRVRYCLDWLHLCVFLFICMGFITPSPHTHTNTPFPFTVKTILWTFNYLYGDKLVVGIASIKPTIAFYGWADFEK